MRKNHGVAPLLPVVTGAILILWGAHVLYTAFTKGSMDLAGWQTDRKNHFGLTWFIAYSIVLLPVYFYAINLGILQFRADSQKSDSPQKNLWATAFGVTTLLIVLTFCTRVTVTAWFASPIHIPFEDYQGGIGPGILATVILLIAEAAVLFAIKNQSERKRQPAALLVPGFFAVILSAWAGWIAVTAFKEGSLPVVGWQTDHPRAFGAMWVAAFIVVLLPAYLYAMGLGLLGLLERTSGKHLANQNSWLVAIGFTALLGLLTFGTRVAVTAWFNQPMHPPLQYFQGGIVAGMISTLILGMLVILFHRLARAF